MSAPDLPEALTSALDAGDYDDAAAWLLSHRWPDGPAVLDAAWRVADAVLGPEPDTAARLLHRLITFAAASGDDREVEVRQMHIDACARAGDPGGARAGLEAIRPLLDAMPVAKRRIYLSNIATFLERSGDLTIAADLLTDAIGTFDSSEPGDAKTRLALAVAHVNLATVYANPARRDWDAAMQELDLAEAALGDAVDEADLNDTRGNIWFNRAHIESERSGHGTGMEAYEQARRWFLAGNARPYDLAYLDRSVAAALGVVGRIDEAQALQESAIERFLAAGAFDEAARTEIGRLASAGNRPPGDEEQLVAERRLARANPAALAELAMNRGALALNAGDIGAALERFERARRGFARQGRRSDVARVDLNRAVALRHAGQRLTARRILMRVRRVADQEDVPRLAAHAANNLAALSLDLGQPARGRDEVLAAIAYLDRERHRLPSAHDRYALTTTVYPRLFELALRIAQQLDDPALATALAERARLQVGAALDGGPLADPRPVRATTGAIAVPGEGATVDLGATAEAIGAPGAHWLTWAVRRGGLIRCHLVGGVAVVDDVALGAHSPLDALTLALPNPHSLDVEAADDPRLQRRMAVYRAARGPLLRDHALAERLARTIPRSARAPIDDALGRSKHADPYELFVDLADLLLPPSASRALLEGDASLVLAPPPALGSVPWPALLLESADRTLVECADLHVAPPVSLLLDPRRHPADIGSGRAVWVADPRGDLPFCRFQPHGRWVVLSATTSPPATADALLDALSAGADLLVVRGHVHPGEPVDPSAAALLLSEGTALSARDLSRLEIAPRECLLLGCDASGGGTGLEWSGIATALLAAGSATVVTTQFGVVDDPEQEAQDLALVDAVTHQGAAAGTWRYQRAAAAAWRQNPSAPPPQRWANAVVLSGTGVVGDDRPDLIQGDRDRPAVGIGDVQGVVEDRGDRSADGGA